MEHRKAPWTLVRRPAEPCDRHRRAPRQVPCYQGLPLSGALAQ